MMKTKLKLPGAKALIRLAFIITLIPFFYTLYYASPSPDDFAMADIDRSAGLLSESLRLTADYWRGWVGMWFSSFYETFFNPLNIFDDIRGPYGFTMICVMLFFTTSVIVLMRTILKELLSIRDSNVITALTLMTAFVFLNADIYFESFAWFVGSHYCIAVSLSFFFTALLIMHMKHDRGPVSLAAMSLLGLVTCSNYLVALPLGVVYLWAMYLKYGNKSTGRPKISRVMIALIPLFACIIGGCSAVFAPGNFSRRDGSLGTGGVNIKTVLQNTFISTSDFTKLLIFNPLLFFSGLIFIYLIYRAAVASKESGAAPGSALLFRRAYVWMSLSFFAVCPLILIPVTFGYDHHDLPNRIEFVYNACFISAFFFLCFTLGTYAAVRIKLEKSFLPVGVLVLLVGIYVSMINPDYLGKLPCTRMVRDRVATRSFGGGWYDILDEIKYSPDDDVVIETTPDMLYLDLDPIIKSPGIAEDPEDGANVLVARYYGKNSVKVISKE